jgi:hypothetical protein
MPSRPSPAPPPKARGSVAVPSAPAASLPEKPPLPTIPPGWLRVRVTLPEGPRDRAFDVVVVTSDGSIEKRFSNDDSDQDELHPLAPGRKLVLLFSPSGSLETTTAFVTIAEDAESSLDLSPPASVPLKGEVVDASGMPVSGVEVEIEESLSYGGKFAPIFPDGIFSRGLLGVEPGGYSYGCSIREKEMCLTRGFRTDARGRFVLPAGPNQAAVPVRILREGKPLKEEVILASKAPFRLVIPGVAGPPKK